MSTEMTLPDWVYKDRRPETDNAYFENLTRCIFQAGLSWQLIANKWSCFQKAFDGFEIPKVAAYSTDDIKRLSEDPSIIRNKRKILATLHNAREFERITKERKSFQKWLDGIDKSNNYDLVLKRLKATFKHIGSSNGSIFLWSVGEPIKHDPSMHRRQPSKIV
ncbi:MAG: DNA-3-methyladenine glycosylase I [Candidatus Bathyarchaeota archaeon]|nr:DNA-3-methyladenine glycosylase I [Candidatus Bathyarchaeota archaeon]